MLSRQRRQVNSSFMVLHFRRKDSSCPVFSLYENNTPILTPHLFTHTRKFIQMLLGNRVHVASSLFKITYFCGALNFCWSILESTTMIGIVYFIELINFVIWLISCWHLLHIIEGRQPSLTVIEAHFLALMGGWGVCQGLCVVLCRILLNYKLWRAKS